MIGHQIQRLIGKEAQRASRHLLRNLDNPDALRTNQLVAGIFISSRAAGKKEERARGSSRVRALMEQFARELLRHQQQIPSDLSLRRQYEIFHCCDLHRESHSSVAAKLGLSARQFYRERRLLTGRVAEFLLSRLSLKLSSDAGFMSEVDRANTLRHAGAHEQAENLLTEIIANADSSMETQWALLSLSRLYLSQVRLPEMRRCVTVGLELARREPVRPEEYPFMPVRFKTELADELFFSGQIEESAQVDAWLHDFFKKHAASIATIDGEVVASAYIRGARRKLLAGDVDASLTALGYAQAYLPEGCGSRFAEACYFLIYGQATAAAGGAEVAAETAFSEAVRLASHFGMSAIVLDGQVGWALTLKRQGKLRDSCTLLRRCLPIALRFRSRYLFFAISLWIAQMEIEMGEAPYALMDALHLICTQNAYDFQTRCLLRAFSMT